MSSHIGDRLVLGSEGVSSHIGDRLVLGSEGVSSHIRDRLVLGSEGVSCHIEDRLVPGSEGVSCHIGDRLVLGSEGVSCHIGDMRAGRHGRLLIYHIQNKYKYQQNDRRILPLNTHDAFHALDATNAVVRVRVSFGA